MAPSEPGSTSSTQAPHVGTKHSVSVGATAGIAVGCAAAGAIITAIVFLLFTMASKNRRSRHPRNSHQGRQVRSHPGEPKEAAIVTISIPESSSAAVIQNHLQAPAEERAITSDFSKIHDKIAGHVQSYYRSTSAAPLNDSSTVETLSQVLGLNTGSELQHRLPTLLNDLNARTSLLRATLARIIIPRVDPESSPDESLLPREVAIFFHSIGQIDYNHRVRTAFLSKHHAMTAFLLPPNQAQAIPDAAITSAVRLADSILGPFSSCKNDAEDEARVRNLEEIMKRAARFGYVLVSQPTLWRFEWRTTSGPAQEGLTVWPDLVQMTDEEGRVLRAASGSSAGKVAAEGVRVGL